MINCVKTTMLCAVLTMLFCSSLVAQEPTFDYREFKFYKEDAYEPLWLMEVDSLSSEQPMLGFNSAIPTYFWSHIAQNRRGVGYHEQRYIVGNLEIDYATSRLLTTLRYDREEAMGVGSVGDGAALVSTVRYKFSEPRPYSRYHALRGEFSGRNYLGGLSYAGRFKPSSSGVGLKDDPSVGVVARAYGGRDLYVEGVFSNKVEIGADVVLKAGRGVFDAALLLAWSERGLRQASTEEAFTLLGNALYNPSWGMQNGRERNARIARELRPELLASWRTMVGSFTEFMVSADIVYEADALTSLAWYDAASPLPDNYRLLPSYFEREDVALEVEQAWRRNDLRYTQIDWDALYHTNYLATDGHAVYAVERRHSNRFRGGLGALFRSTYNVATIDYGVSLDYVAERNFKRMDDLLGAQYIYDYDYFYVGDDTATEGRQNNMAFPNRRVYLGDKFGYDYRTSQLRARLFAEAEWRLFGNLFSAGASIALEGVQRRGFYEKELFPGALSYGKSPRVKLAPYALHAAWLRVFDIHKLSACLLLRGDMPDVDNLFLQPQYNNRVVDNAHLATTFAAQMTYSIMSQRTELLVQPYFIVTGNECDVVRYYDDLSDSYCDAVVSGIGRLSYGIEATANVTYTRRLTSQFMLRVGDAHYRKDAEVVLYNDDNNNEIATSKSHIGGCRTSMPTLSLHANVRYRSLNGWSATLAVQYHALRHVEPSLVRRMERVVSFASSPEERAQLMSQQHLPNALCFDVEVAKRFDFDDAGMLYLRLGVRNILGGRMVYSSYEQNRVRTIERGGYMAVTPFDNKLTYAYPRTFLLNVSYYF